eukprot:2119245-Amphidinium_carterae.1
MVQHRKAKSTPTVAPAIKKSVPLIIRGSAWIASTWAEQNHQPKGSEFARELLQDWNHCQMQLNNCGQPNSRTLGSYDIR